MSYDLMLFDPQVAPRDRAAFEVWYEQVTRWAEGKAPHDPATTSSALRDVFEVISKAWPNLQTVDQERVDDPEVAEYSFAPRAVYMAFNWEVAEQAYDAIRNAAVEHGVGFYDVSGDDGDREIYFPGDVLRPPSGGAWRQVAADFRAGS